MKELTSKNFDSVIAQGNKLLVFIYSEKNQIYSIQLERIFEIDQMLAKDFDIYTVNVDFEPLIAEAFSIKDTPEIIVLNHSKISSRSKALLYTNQILDMISKAK